MEAPTKGKPFTSSSSARAPAEEYEDDEEESLGSNEIQFGSNEGEVALPMIWCQVTQQPEH